MMYRSNQPSPTISKPLNLFACCTGKIRTHKYSRVWFDESDPHILI